MKFRLTIIILIGVVATGITLYLNTQNDGTNPEILSFNKPTKKKQKTDKITKAEKQLVLSRDKYIATHRNEAQIISKAVPGREDPFEPIENVISIHKKLKKQAGVEEKVEDLPPPPDETSSESQGLLPPPPVLTGMNLPPGPGQSISTSELPLPPENQELNNKLSLNAVVGDKAILAFNDTSYARAHDYNKYITLGRGDSFESIKLVDIDSHMVVLEENGITHELKLTEIR